MAPYGPKRSFEDPIEAKSAHCREPRTNTPGRILPWLSGVAHISPKAKGSCLIVGVCLMAGRIIIITNRAAK